MKQWDCWIISYIIIWNKSIFSTAIWEVVEKIHDTYNAIFIIFTKFIYQLYFNIFYSGNSHIYQEPYNVIPAQPLPDLGCLNCRIVIIWLFTEQLFKKSVEPQGGAFKQSDHEKHNKFAPNYQGKLCNSQNPD